VPNTAVTCIEFGTADGQVQASERSLRRFADWSMTALARVLVRVFFRSIEIEDREQLPDAGPVVLVANHTNGLVDGLLLMAALRRYPRFLGKSTLFKVPPLWPFLKLAGVIPVYRAIDAGTGDHNVSAFATSHSLLRDGRVVAVFPEGISHDEVTLQPLRTGAARIALEVAADAGAEDLVTVAVGLVYDAKARFRSRALVRVGQPEKVAHWAEAYRRDERATVRALTEDLAAQLERVNPSFSSWAQATQLSWIAELVVRGPGEDASGDPGLADRVHVAAHLAAQQDACPESLQQLFLDFASYERDLELLGVSDAQLVAASRGHRLGLPVAWSALKVLVALPFAALGALVHVIPFQIMKQVGKRPTNEGIKATVKLLGCFVLFAATYAVVGVLVGRTYGAWAGLGAALATPLCGFLAVRFLERVRRFGGVAEGCRIIKVRRNVLGPVLARRVAVVREARSILQQQ
jgi:glycerol-3-phosphate O-acyltransferase/dihydroxyacetone phosphate acyltransferase